ncbi:hypothetical protein NQ318_018187 [Aromia moschata]|uniref:Zinc finger PHD-type domain-containing protein n=1 Tax=Aromia moschata TaxID=1265417 RepID=A0AAV8ZDE3_9CUCU|nr:hypothetical protein NQ318_018187 [Aromia moschata]
MSLRQASVKYDIPKSTLHDKVASLNAGKEVSFVPKMGRFSKTFSPEYEELLVNHVKDLSNRCLPLMKKEFLKLAYDLAVALNIPHRFNCEKSAAGKHFYYDFMARHPDLSLRTPESMSMMRAVGFNKPQVDLFFINLDKLMTLYNFSPSNIYNCDETGVSCVQKHQKVIAPKTVRQVGKLTSAERGKNITILFCMSANGYFIPPFFVFPRQRMNDRLMINAPAQSIAMAQPKGWMNSDFFLQWMKHFTKFSHPSKENPVLLLLDGHSSHKTLDVINFCREHHIHLMSSPPHTTHKLQPLDRTFMKPFKNAYHEQCDMWMRANAGARITDYDIAGLVNGAYTKVARLEIAVSGFKCTGICPFNKNIFSDLDYLPADMTNIPLEKPGSSQSTSSIPKSTKNSTSGSSIDVVPNVVPDAVTDTIPMLPTDYVSEPANNSVPKSPTSAIPQLVTRTSCISQPSTSFSPEPSTSSTLVTRTSCISQPSTSFSPEPSTSSTRPPALVLNHLEALLQMLSKLSKTYLRCQTQLKDAQLLGKGSVKKSEILTSSPYKIAVEEKENEKKAKEAKKGVKKKFAVLEENEKQAKCRKEISAKKCVPKKTGQENSNTKTECVVCLEDYDEDWIQCCSCQGWAHEACADIPECSDAYICDHCNIF